MIWETIRVMQYQSLRAINLLFWASYWIGLIVTTVRCLFMIGYPRRLALSISVWSALMAGLLYGTWYFYLLSRNAPLGGHSVLFHFWYGLAGLVFSCIALVAGFLARDTTYLTMLLATVSFFAFGVELGIVPDVHEIGVLLFFSSLLGAFVIFEKRRYATSPK